MDDGLSVWMLVVPVDVQNNKIRIGSLSDACSEYGGATMKTIVGGV